MIYNQNPRTIAKRITAICAMLAASAACVLTLPAYAAEIEVLTLESGSKVIVLEGEISKGDSAKFRTVAAQIDDAAVVLESEGGSTMEALEIGETIRIKGFSTLVVNGTLCVSACGLIWLSGSPRGLAQSAQVGFHATYTDESGRKLESGVGNALVGRYLALLNLPRKAVVFTTSAPPEKMNWLNASNASLYGIDIKVIDNFSDRTSSSSVSQDRQRQQPPPILQPPTIVTGPNAKARETTNWGEAGGWVIKVDHTLDNSCFAMRVYEDGTVLRIGFNAAESKNYFVIANSDWSSLQEGETYPINIQFDANDTWDAPATGVKFGTLTVLYTIFSDSEFWAEFAISRAVKITRNGRLVGNYLLDGSYKAFEMVIECQKTFNQGRQKRDPFAD